MKTIANTKSKIMGLGLTAALVWSFQPNYLLLKIAPNLIAPVAFAPATFARAKFAPATFASAALGSIAFASSTNASANASANTSANTSANASASDAGAVPDERHGLSKRWSLKSPELVIAEAKRTNKNVLLYWGAVWCPPCNELKKEVFNRPDFDSITKEFLLVYLDGDGESAQVWGEKFKVSGYPSVLLLNSNGNEITKPRRKAPCSICTANSWGI